MYRSTPSASPASAPRRRTVPTAPMLSATGHPRVCAWCAGSPWGSPPGPGRRCGARSQSLSWFSSCVPPRSPTAFFSFQLYYPQDLEVYSISAAGFLWKNAMAKRPALQLLVRGNTAVHPFRSAASLGRPPASHLPVKEMLHLLGKSPQRLGKVLLGIDN